MIVRRDADKLVLTYQTEHARLSGELARMWNWPIPLRESTLYAATHHDDGWATWEKTPQVSEDGNPVDFMSIQTPEHVELFAQSSRLVVAQDPTAGLIVSMHGERLYSRGFEPGRPSKLEGLTSDNLKAAEAFVECERALQAHLLATDPVSQVDSEEAWRLLQVWDRVSLWIGVFGPHASKELPAVARPGSGGDSTGFTMSCRGNEVHMSPFPFAESFELHLDQIEIENKTYATSADLTEAIQNANHVRTELHFAAK